MTTSLQMWGQRDQVLQSLYIPAFLQTAMPHHLLGDEISGELRDAIVKWDLPVLQNSFQYNQRNAATRFFNLPSARRAIEVALRSELTVINDWLRVEKSVRFTFDYFAAQSGPYVGYGVHQSNSSEILFTRILRVVLQRSPENEYVLWSAYPLLSPRYSCWHDVYDEHPNRSRGIIKTVFYYFLSNYLSVTSDCLMVDPVTHGTVDFWKFESNEKLKELRSTIEYLHPGFLHDQDAHHLNYELLTRCLDETLPREYFDDIDHFLHLLRTSLDRLVDAEKVSWL